MSNNKFHFEFQKKKNPKIQDYFPSYSKKKLQLCLSLKFIIFIFLKKKFKIIINANY